MHVKMVGLGLLVLGLAGCNVLNEKKDEPDAGAGGPEGRVLSPEAIQRYCMFAGAGLARFGADSFGECVWHESLQVLRWTVRGGLSSGLPSGGISPSNDAELHAVDCAGRSTDPDSFTQCISPGGCDAAMASLSTCDGDLRCYRSSGTESYLVVVDCGDLGGTCSEGECTVAAEPACEGFKRECSDNRILECSAAGDTQKEVVALCSPATTCEVSGTTAKCSTGKECNFSEEKCEGDVLVSCLDGQEFRTDCSSLGYKCGRSALTSSLNSCQFAGSGCNHVVAGESCDGTKLKDVCVNGEKVTIDCATVGLSCGKPDSYSRPRCLKL